MSLERTALRLAATMALSNAYLAPFPTIAGTNVFDSRQDPLEGLAAGDRVPILVLYTDDDAGSTLSQNNGGPPFEQKVHLVMELSLGMVVPVEGADPTLVLPQTEPELEAALDAFEAQVKRVFRDLMGPWGSHLSKCMRGIENWESRRYIDREANVRLAARQITALVRLPLEAETVVSTEEVAAQIPEPLASLLTDVAASDSPFAPTAAAIVTMLTSYGAGAPVILPALTTIRFIEDERDDQDRRTNPRSQPPDPGVAESNLA